MFGTGAKAAGRGVAFLIGAATVAEFIAKDVSSPQTTEINVHQRAGTLLKWVHVGQVEALGFLIIAALIDDPSYAVAFLAGGVLEMAVTELEYLHAKQSGLQNPGPPTEQYGEPDNGSTY